jgi:hypothetical protein
MRASECFAQHHGGRAADPGEFEPASIRPSLSLRWCIWAADRLAVTTTANKVDSVH